MWKGFGFPAAQFRQGLLLYPRHLAEFRGFPGQQSRQRFTEKKTRADTLTYISPCCPYFGKRIVNNMGMPAPGNADTTTPVVGEAHALELWKEIQRDPLAVLGNGCRVSQRVLRAAAGEIVAACADDEALIRRPLQIGRGAREIGEGLIVMEANIRPLLIGQWFRDDHASLNGDDSTMQWVAHLGVALSRNNNLVRADTAAIAIDAPRTNTVRPSVLKNPDTQSLHYAREPHHEFRRLDSSNVGRKHRAARICHLHASG